MDDYQLIKEAGEGVSSKVYQAVRKSDKKEFALKIVSMRFLKMVYMFKKQNNQYKNYRVHHAMIERDVLLDLKHPGIISLNSTFALKDSLIFVMEYAPENFANFLQLYNKRIPFNVIQFYVAEILLTLEYIHKKGYIHRDLKPENIVLNQHKHVKLIDFGTCAVYNPDVIDPNILNKIKTAFDEFCQLSGRQNEFVGTSSYLSPEMINDKFIGPASDLWALGILTYKLFAGHVPFNADDEIELFNKICNQEIEFPQSVPLQVQDFINQLTKKDPERRQTNYAKLKEHQFFQGIDFQINLFEMKTPNIDLKSRKSKTFIESPICQQDLVIFEEILEKDSGFLINYFTPRHLFLCIQQGQPTIYYTNPKLNDKKTTVKINHGFQYLLMKQDKFVLIDDQKLKYIFKTPNAKKWIEQIDNLLKK